jgi:hypothetical protein
MTVEALGGADNRETRAFDYEVVAKPVVSG